MSTYPHKAEQYMNEARASLIRIKSSQTIYEVNEAFISFLNASRFVFQSWKKDYKKLEGFDIWWSEKSNILKHDELCDFFRNLRNSVIKEGKEPFWVNQTIKGPMIIKGPIQICSQGILRGSFEGSRPKWGPVAIKGVSTMVGFKEAPKNYKELNPFEICQRYLETLDKILDEFIISFCKI
jgi:hypothetical protein